MDTRCGSLSLVGRLDSSSSVLLFLETDWLRPTTGRRLFRMDHGMDDPEDSSAWNSLPFGDGDGTEKADYGNRTGAWDFTFHAAISGIRVACSPEWIVAVTDDGRRDGVSEMHIWKVEGTLPGEPHTTIQLHIDLSRHTNDWHFRQGSSGNADMPALRGVSRLENKRVSWLQLSDLDLERTYQSHTLVFEKIIERLVLQRHVHEYFPAVCWSDSGSAFVVVVESSTLQERKKAWLYSMDSGSTLPLIEFSTIFKVGCSQFLLQTDTDSVVSDVNKPVEGTLLRRKPLKDVCGFRFGGSMALFSHHGESQITVTGNGCPIVTLMMTRSDTTLWGEFCPSALIVSQEGIEPATLGSEVQYSSSELSRSDQSKKTRGRRKLV
ncbi:hypothetical protein Pelo_651 [Pelomyxa schiedti]|nr:hypothetical protein Pelo_651 [Pelomyxa schiedti]